MHKIYYITSEHLDSLFLKLKSTHKLFSTVAKESVGQETDYFYKSPAEADSFKFNPYRAVEPLKTFFTYPHESATATEPSEKTVIFGAKSCDLTGHKIQDFVFLEGVEVDSMYRLRRENTIIISGDCTDFKKVCFCLALEVLPHPENGFDLNLSPLNEGYLVEVGSVKGAELIVGHKQLFLPAKDVQISARKAKRQTLIERLKRHLLPQNIPPKDLLQKLVKDGYSLDTWKTFMQTCVECGGCNLICDTCHCFLLADTKQSNTNIKVKAWDSCLYANYARVAGGANPLKTRTQRLRNRFMKKFDFFPDNIGMPACCGCGRCIEVCPGKIDLREVQKDLAKKLQLTY